MAQQKELSGAYIAAVVGLLLGVLGMHRFYLRHHLSAIVLTLVFVVGLFMFVKEIVVQYQALLGQLLGALSSGAALHDIPNLEQEVSPPGNHNRAIAGALCGIGLIWWVVDLFLLPGMVKRYNAAQQD